MAGEAAQHAADEGAHLLELGAAEAARGGRRRAEAAAGGPRRLLRIEANAVLVAGAAGAVESLLGEFSGPLLWPQIHKHEVVVGDRKSTRMNSSHKCASRIQSNVCKTHQAHST